MKLHRITLPFVIIASLAFAGCGTTEVEPDAIALKYTTGFSEGRHFETIIEPGDTKFEINDEIFQIPTNQRSFRIELDKTADVDGRLVVAAGGSYVSADGKSDDDESSDAVRLAFELVTAFKVNTNTTPFKDAISGKQYDGGMAQKFYEELCRRYDCALEDGKTPAGFRLLLREKLYSALQAAFKDEVRRFRPDDVVNNATIEVTNADGQKVKRPAQEVLLEAVGKRFLVTLEKQTGGKYFCGPTFDRSAKGEAADCPPVELLIVSVDYENPKVQESRENKKVAADQVAAANTVKEALKDPSFLEYQKIQACRETKGTCVIGLDGVGVNAVKP